MVELLAPAGNMEAFIGVINAGADAVYLGGEKFGARAYAKNFTTEEIVEACKIAHLRNRKIYLTLNTLIKEREYDQLYDYIKPMYESGLDGIIIQDYGVLKFCEEYFPNMECHASTQMTITGSEGVRFLQKNGVCRVVPARELSLEELRQIKQETGVTLETFIHGAICYCYSGQCLFSSFLGGRSGNRGRCAGPCRLEYQTKIDGKQQYPLSLKDMCTIEQLPKLVEAGIDSFKIEGRMKKPEYASGVTAIYRKYIDLYFQNPTSYQVDPEDLEKLNHLYIRSERSDGYYFRRNGREMITLRSPGYFGTDEQLVKSIRQTYLQGIEKIPICMEIQACVGEKLDLHLSLWEHPNMEIQMKGPIVEEAQKKPLSKEDMEKQFSKLGNTDFYMKNIQLSIEGNVFLPIGKLNELRREAITRLEELYLKKTLRNAKPNVNSRGAVKEKIRQNISTLPVSASVRTLEQLEVVAKHPLVNRIYIPEQLWKQVKTDKEKYLCLPRITRQSDDCSWKRYEDIDGILVSNLEQLNILIEKGYDKQQLVADSSLYLWNRESVSFLKNYVGEVSFPLELSYHEKNELGEGAFEQTIYGRIPLMHTANCIQKTCDRCKKSGSSFFTELKDRYQKNFPVEIDCRHCINILYNSVPLSLHNFIAKEKLPIGTSRLRMDFTIENTETTRQLLDGFHELLVAGKTIDFISDFTTGHEKQAVE